MEIVLLAALILLNGVLAMSEIALVAARRARLVNMAEEGRASAAAAIELHDQPTAFLSTVQVGITSIAVLSGVIGEAALAAPLAGWLQSLGVEAEASPIAATALVVIVITYVTIVVGELVPKRIAQFDPERIACRVARPMRLLARVASPFVRLLSVSTDGVLHLLGKHPQPTPAVIEEEIHALLQEGSETGAIEQQEREMVRNVFHLDYRPVESLMVPRAGIVCLDTTRPLQDNLAAMIESDHTHFPVCRDGFGEVLGVLSAKQLLNTTLAGAAPSLTDALLPAVFVPENLSGLTPRDVLEAIAGEFKPEKLDEAWAIQREDGSWLLDGLIRVPELKDTLRLKSVPDEGRRRYHTLSGMVMWLSGELPKTGDVLVWENWRLEVVDIDGKRIDKILATPIARRQLPPLSGRSGRADAAPPSLRRQSTSIWPTMPASRCPGTRQAKSTAPAWSNCHTSPPRWPGASRIPLASA